MVDFLLHLTMRQAAMVGVMGAVATCVVIAVGACWEREGGFRTAAALFLAVLFLGAAFAIHQIGAA